MIAQTAYAMSDDRDKCMAAGFNEYITKPIKPEELLEKMQLFIGK
jgi:CheY-like chemotaxis protein